MLSPFEYWFFLVTVIHPEAHINVYVIGDIVEGRCAQLLSKYWTESHFLMGNEVYVYKKEDLTAEYLYHKKQKMGFISDLGYFGGGTPCLHWKVVNNR